MTNSDAVRIASRAIVLYLFIVAAASVIGMLFETANLVQAKRNWPGRLPDTQLMSLASVVLHITVDVAIGLWLYRCGPRIQAFFAVSDSQ
jgi:hypothetical protein